MNPVVHFEMPADDRVRMADFYTRAFGWKAQLLGPEMGNYVTVATVETDDKGRPIKPGAIGGGFYPKQEGSPQCPSIVIAVDDIHKSIKTVTELGGKVLDEPLEIPTVGMYVAFLDTEGNRVGLLQPIM